MSSIKTDSAIGGQTSSAKKTLNTAIALCGKRGGRTSILKGAVKIDGKYTSLIPGCRFGTAEVKINLWCVCHSQTVEYSPKRTM